MEAILAVNENNVEGSLEQICKDDFPIFEHRRGLVYLDSAASTQKPREVTDSIRDFYHQRYANVHRGVYKLGEEATLCFEESREKVRRFLNASSCAEIIFTRGTTEAINLVAHSWGRSFLKPGDEILTTILEHHSNFVPWQQLASATGASISYAGLDAQEDLDLDDFFEKLNSRTKLVAITHLANGIGVEPPIAEIIHEAHKVGAVVLVDAAQAVSSKKVDVQQLDVDFLAFSGHKLYGPTGIGVLYAKRSHLEAMPPFLCGGEMISSVSVEGTTFNELPYKFEAGTPHTAGAVGLGAAIDYVTRIGLENISAHEKRLVRLAEARLAEIDGMRILGPIGEHVGLVSFVLDEVHPHDLAQYLDQQGIAVRAGHHCAQPLLTSLGLNASTRASFGVYNSESDIDRLAEAIEDAISFFG